VLHLAPSGMKLRGHLGSEVQRKAAGILLIEKDDSNNCSVVKALKVRDGSPLDVPMMQFGWNKTEGRHVYLGQKSKEDSEIRKTNELKDVATDIFRNKVFISNQNLYKAIMESMDVKERTARSYIKFMREKGIIEKNPNNSLEYSLISMPF
jgi:predicted transcriptional regulator